MLDHTPIGKGLYLEDGTCIPWDVFVDGLQEAGEEYDEEILDALKKIALNEESS